MGTAQSHTPEKILVVEDDAALVQLLAEYLKREGFDVSAASGEREAQEALTRETFSLVLIDILLSEGDGFGVCSIAREQGIPVIFLTASGDENCVVRGLDMGADDYIAKPFRPRELVARIRGVLRRSGKAPAAVSLGEVKVELEKGVVTKGGQEVPLSALEWRLLTFFLQNRGRLLSRYQLLEDIWDADGQSWTGDFVNDNTLTVYIKRLREKLEDDPRNPTLIKTVRGLGYRMD